MVPMGCIACDACGHQPPAHVSAKGGGKGSAKGAGKGAGRRGNEASQPTAGEKQLKAELEASRQELAKLKKEATKTKAAVEVAATPLAADEAPADESTKLALEIQGEIKELKGDLQFYASLPEDRRHRILGGKDGYDNFVADTKAKLEECFKRQQGSRTFKQQLASAQGKEQRMEKAAAADETALASLREQLAKLQTDVAAQVDKAAKSKAELGTATAEVKRLAAATAAEGAPPSHLLPGAEQGSAAQMSIEQLQATSVALQASLDQFHAEANDRYNAIMAVKEQMEAAIEVDSDDESIAPSEPGDDPTVRKGRCKAKKRKKLAEQFGKITSKFNNAASASSKAS